MHNGTESLLTADLHTIISTCLYGNKGRIFEVSLNEILLDLQCILGERVQFFLQHPALVGGAEEGRGRLQLCTALLVFVGADEVRGRASGARVGGAGEMEREDHSSPRVVSESETGMRVWWPGASGGIQHGKTLQDQCQPAGPRGGCWHISSALHRVTFYRCMKGLRLHPKRVPAETWQTTDIAE